MAVGDMVVGAGWEGGDGPGMDIGCGVVRGVRVLGGGSIAQKHGTPVTHRCTQAPGIQCVYLPVYLSVMYTGIHTPHI